MKRQLKGQVELGWLVAACFNAGGILACLHTDADDPGEKERAVM